MKKWSAASLVIEGAPYGNKNAAGKRGGGPKWEVGQMGWKSNQNGDTAVTIHRSRFNPKTGHAEFKQSTHTPPANSMLRIVRVANRQVNKGLYTRFHDPKSGMTGITRFAVPK